MPDLNLEQKSQAIFLRAEAIPVQASPYLKRRVLAELNARHSHRHERKRWQSLASAAGCSLFVVRSWTLRTHNGFVAKTGEAIAVKLEIESVQSSVIAA